MWRFITNHGVLGNIKKSSSILINIILVWVWIMILQPSLVNLTNRCCTSVKIGSGCLNKEHVHQPKSVLRIACGLRLLANPFLGCGWNFQNQKRYIPTKWSVILFFAFFPKVWFSRVVLKPKIADFSFRFRCSSSFYNVIALYACIFIIIIAGCF